MKKIYEDQNYNGLIFEATKIDLNNIPKVDSHLHTNWTDGEASVQEVYDKAVNEQLEFILFSEHSRKTSTDWFHKFSAEVRALPTYPCKALVGTEVKVESIDGEIDTNDSIVNDCDLIMASVHRFIDKNNKTIQFADTDPNFAVDIEFDLSLAVLENPKVDILGHMFGMSYKRFNRTPSDDLIRELIKKASKFDVAVEVNSYYHPNALKMINWCKEFNAKITFGSNAHTLNEVGFINKQIKMELTNA